MSRWGYNLQSVVVASGTLDFDLYVEAESDPQLLLPDYPSLMMLSGVGERQDVRQIGLVEIESVDFKFVEDYTNYTEGFWCKILQLPIEIRLTLDEGGGAKHFFWGIPSSGTISLNEVDLTVNSIQRHGEFTCLSLLTKLQDVLVSDLLTVVATRSELGTDPFSDNASIGNANGSNYVNMKVLMASILSEGFSQEYSLDNIIVIPAANSDIQFEVYDDTAGVKWGTWADLWLYLDDYEGEDFTGYLKTGSTATASWVFKFGDCWSLFRMLCKHFSLTPSHWYDDATAKHKLTFYAGPRSDGALIAEPGVPMRSTYLLEFSTPNPSIIVRSPAWGFPTPDVVFSHHGTIVEGEPDAGLDFEMRIDNELRTVDFDSLLARLSLYRRQILYKYTTARTCDPHAVNLVRYYDYTTEAYVEIGTTVGQYNSLAYAQVGLALWKFNKNRKAFERTYPTIKGRTGILNSQTLIHLLRPVPIDDGGGSADYYITEYEKDPIKDEMKLKLIEV